MGGNGSISSFKIRIATTTMNFKKWIKLSETKSSVRYKPSGGALNQGFLRGSAATYGHTDSPDPLEKAGTAVVSGLGSSLRSSLENDSGLVVQGVGRILSPPEQEENTEAHYNYLPLQLPVYTYNKNPRKMSINVNSNRIFKDVLNPLDANIRTVDGTYGIQEGVSVEGAFTLLYKDEEGNLNGEYSTAKQFTTALIYKLIVEGLIRKDEIKKYDITKPPEVIGEEIGDDNVLLVWFRLNLSESPQEMKDGKPDVKKEKP